MMTTSETTACDKTPTSDMEVEALDGTLTEKGMDKATGEKNALDVVDAAPKDEGMGTGEMGKKRALGVVDGAPKDEGMGMGVGTGEHGSLDVVDGASRDEGMGMGEMGEKRALDVVDGAPRDEGMVADEERCAIRANLRH